MRDAPACGASPSRWTPRTCCSSSTPRARPESRRESSTPPAAISSARRRRRRIVFDLKEDDVFWCTADVGWVTGHSYLVVRPARERRDVRDVRGRARLAGEGSLLGDLRAARRDDPLHRAHRHPRVHEVGRPVAREARPLAPPPARLRRRADQPGSVDVVSRAHRRQPLPDRRHVVADGDRLDRDLAAARRSPRRSPAARRRRSPATAPRCSTRRANEIPVGGGLLALTRPWPSMLRTIWGDDERYVETYFSKWPGRPDLYFPGDGAKRDEDGYYWILGRVDDVLNVAGHRIGTMEVESALVEHPAVAEAAVVGKTHELKGQAIAAFVTLREGFQHEPRAARRAARVRRREDRRDRAAGRHPLLARICRRRARARSCAACCATSPKAERWATRRRWRIRTS